MKFEEFIKYIRIFPECKCVELTNAQYSFLHWIEKCKENKLNPFILKLRGRI